MREVIVAERFVLSSLGSNQSSSLSLLPHHRPSFPLSTFNHAYPYISTSNSLRQGAFPFIFHPSDCSVLLLCSTGRPSRNLGKRRADPVPPSLPSLTVPPPSPFGPIPAHLFVRPLLGECFLLPFPLALQLVSQTAPSASSNADPLSTFSSLLVIHSLLQVFDDHIVHQGEGDVLIYIDVSSRSLCFC